MVTRVHCTCFAISELVTSDVGVHRWWQVGNSGWKTKFHKTIFSTTSSAFFKFKFTLVLRNYIYLNWNKQLYFVILKFSSFFPSEVGNIALRRSNKNVKVTRSNLLVHVLTERSCHNKHSCEISKSYYIPFKRYWNG
jgi:hypothetical protein